MNFFFIISGPRLIFLISMVSHYSLNEVPRVLFHLLGIHLLKAAAYQIKFLMLTPVITQYCVLFRYNLQQNKA